MTTLVKTELPGSVWKILVRPGDRVEVGTVLFIIEVMKTEVPHPAPVAGTVRAILLNEGDFVDGDQPAVELV